MKLPPIGARMFRMPFSAAQPFPVSLLPKIPYRF